jgi:hypothetical protein
MSKDTGSTQTKIKNKEILLLRDKRESNIIVKDHETLFPVYHNHWITYGDAFVCHVVRSSQRVKPCQALVLPKPRI